MAFSDARPALKAALTSGRTVGILTNGAKQMQEAKVKVTGLHLPGVTLLPTVELGAPKPDPKAYAAALDIMASSPATTLMIGDNYLNDVLAARACGLSAVYLNRSAGSSDSPQQATQDSATIRSLSELIWY